MYQSKIQIFSELSCLLDYFPEEYIYKIPKQLLDTIKQNSDAKYFIKIDTKKSLVNQEILKETKDMLMVLKYNYWSNEEEQKSIREKLLQNEEKYQKKLKEKYNPDNIFKKIENNKIEEVENTALVEYKEGNFLKRILRKVMNFFKRKNF